MMAAETLRALLDERGVEHQDHYLSTTWLDGHGILHLASEHIPNSFLVVDMLTPEQAIAATLGSEINGDTIETHLNQLESSRYSELFGTPERAARTLAQTFIACNNSRKQCKGCPFRDALACPNVDSETALLELLRGDA